MNLKKTLLAVIAIILVTFLIYSCRKDYLTSEEINPRVKWARDYFTRSLLPKEGNAVGRNLLQSSELLAQTPNRANKKITIWERAMEGRTSRFEFVEIPLKYRTKITSLLSVKDENNSSPQVADKGVLNASFDRLVIYKNKKGEIHQMIISFVPTKAYLLRHNGDISHNRINKLDKDFDGTLIYRGWDDKLLFALVIKQGKAVQKLSLSNQIKFKKTAFREENCVEIEIYHWYQYCYYSGDNTEPDHCDEPYSEYGGSYFVCTDEDPCADPTNFGSGDCGGDGGSGGDNQEEEENQKDTDCESFAFSKTSTANWQEAGLNKISLRMVWIGGGNTSVRNMEVNHLVYGLPTYYTNANGTTTPLSAGQAANIAAEATEYARNMTYTEFRNSPSYPSEATIIAYFKQQVNLYMVGHMGTAGTTGSGSSSIIFKNEERSHWTDPTDC